MSRTYRFISALSVAALIVALLFVCVFCFASAGNADAMTISTSTSVSIGELMRSNYQSLSSYKVDGQQLSLLYRYLTGSASATYATVRNLGTRDASYFRGRNSNKDIVLTFGGRQWTPTYLTTDKDGNTILTVMFATLSGSYAFNTYSGNDNMSNYPSNAYSISNIRAQLNSGSRVLNATGSSLTTTSKSSAHSLAKFTMPSVSGSLTQYIVTPSRVDYQETQNLHLLTDNQWNTAFNDAWGTPSGTVEYVDSSFTGAVYTGKSFYNEWKDDYIWTPSICEVGWPASTVADKGLWQLSANQRGNGAQFWTRSGSNAGVAVKINDPTLNVSVSTTAALCGAMHLNLTQLEADKTQAVSMPSISSSSFEFDGSAKSITLSNFDTDKMEITSVTGGTGVSYSGATITATQTGTYTVTVALKASGGGYWNDSTGGYGNRTLTFSITPKSVTRPAISGITSKQYNGEEQTFSLANVSDDVTLTLPDGITYSGGLLTAKNAGTYDIGVALKDEGLNTKWNNGSTTASYSVSVTIEKRPLNITIEAPSSWSVGETPTITITGDSLADDTTELYIYYCRNGSSIKYADINDNKIIEGKTRIITMPELAQGDYYIGVELYGERQGNNNYVILGDKKTHNFKVNGAEVTFDANNDLKWQCNNTNINLPSITSEYVLTYSGEIFRFGIDDSALAEKGVKVDLSMGTNGYTGDVQATDAKSGAYSVTVYLTAYDSSFSAFTAQYSLVYRIEKAKYDLSGISWNYSSPLEYIARTPQGITLTGSLPSGLTVAGYTGNNNIPVGNYTTTVRFAVSDPTNWVLPVSTDTTSYLDSSGAFAWSKDWEIVKKKLDLSGRWKTDDRETSNTYNLPILQTIDGIDVDSLVSYTYYDDTGAEVNPIEIDVNKERTFKVVAQLKAGNDASYELINNELTFTIGQNKYPVIVKLDIADMQLPYRPEGYTGNIEVSSVGGLTVDDIELTYSKDGGAYSTDKPVAVGVYTVKATLTYGGENNYIENSEFTFEIVKADIDVSELKWEYRHGDTVATYDALQGKWLTADGTEAKPFVYDGAVHTLGIAGADSLIATVTVGAAGDLSAVNARSYTASATFTYDADCYNAPDFLLSIEWTINKAIVDTSEIVWGYTAGIDNTEYPYIDSLTYTRVGGAAVEYILKLINLPDALKECIDYSTLSIYTTTASTVGGYKVRYEIDLSRYDSDNYEPCVMPSGLKQIFDWAIITRTIAMPVYDNSWSVFDGEVHDFAAMFGLSADWQEYVSITIKRNGELYGGLTGDDFSSVDGKAYKAYDAGEYLVTFTLINAGSNLIFDSKPQPDIAVSVAKYKYTVEGWMDNDEYSQVTGGILSSFYDYRYVDDEGNILALDELQEGSYYYREVYVKETFADNAEVDGETKYRFLMPLPPDVIRTSVAKPTIDSSKVVYYNGTQRTFDEATLKELFGLTGFNSDYMEIVSDVAGAINAGEYKIKIRLTSGLYCWDNGDGTTSSGDVELALTIAKAQLPSEWSSSGSLPTIDIPEELAGCLDNSAFNYTYTDEDGNTVSASEMVSGKKYSVQATLKEEYAGNFEFVDSEGNVLPDATVSTSYEFDYTDTDGEGGNGSGEAPEGFYDYYKRMLLILVIGNATAAVAFVLIVPLVAAILVRVKRLQKKSDRGSNKDVGKDTEKTDKSDIEGSSNW